MTPHTGRQAKSCVRTGVDMEFSDATNRQTGGVLRKDKRRHGICEGVPLVEFVYFVFAVQVRVAVGDSSFCCNVPCHSCDVCRAPLIPFVLFLDKCLVTTSILLDGCETWTLLADPEKRIQAFENKCMRKLLRISYSEHKTND